MTAVLTLQEKLRDLREEKKLKLDEVSKGTGIPRATLQRLESDKDVRIGYQDIEVLTRFYGVSADYLFGITDNRQYRNIEIDKLRLTDEAVAALISGNLNNKLLSEIIAHPDFADLLAGLEIFLNRIISENMNVVNSTYKIAADTINRQNVKAGRDEYLAALREAIIDPDDYLRFRLSQRFDRLAQSLYDIHGKEAVSETGGGYIKKMTEQIQKFDKDKDKDGAEQAKLNLLADQLGADLSKSTEDEKVSLLNIFKRSKFKQFLKKRK
jgi:transcriptional regulator with XRE-family HTH domain